MKTRIGIDVGGTFTDFVLVDGRRNRIDKGKYPTTPQDPAIGVLEGLELLLKRRDVSHGDVEFIVHGTTLVANAVIERKGAKVGLLATRGLRDALEIRREGRFDLYDLGIQYPEPLVLRHLRRNINERTDHQGRIIEELDMEQLKNQLDDLLSEGIISVAVCLLHSYANPTHEQQIKEFVNNHFPDLYVSISSDITPYLGEYERTSTIVLNAYVQPLAHRYLRHLEDGLRERGFAGDFYLMTSAGGTITVETASQYPVLLVESGPVAGALMSKYVGGLAGSENLLAFDMGGTTAKGQVIKGGVIKKEYAIEVARFHQFKKGSGFPVMIPALQLIEIGAGGGSIASVDELRRLRVGPQSAGADPGPVCYSKGGTQATVTDANLVLGYLNPDFFLGGEMRLDTSVAKEAILRDIGDPLGMDVVEAALGIHEVANENMAQAFRLHAAESGVDIRGHDMVAFGGAGPVHAMRVARKLAVQRVIIPWGAGVFSAFGLLVTPLGFDVAQTSLLPLEELNAKRLEDQFAALEERVMATLQRGQLSPSQIRISRAADLRYRGQGYAVEVGADELEPKDPVKDLESRFIKEYIRLYGVAAKDAPAEVMNWKVTGIGPVDAIDMRLASEDPMPDTACRIKHFAESDPSSALKGHRNIYLPEKTSFQQCPIYDRYSLAPGNVITGPAVVEERESSLVMYPGDNGRVDDKLNILITLSDAES